MIGEGTQLSTQDVSLRELIRQELQAMNDSSNSSGMSQESSNFHDLRQVIREEIQQMRGSQAASSSQTMGTSGNNQTSSQNTSGSSSSGTRRQSQASSTQGTATSGTNQTSSPNASGSSSTGTRGQSQASSPGGTRSASSTSNVSNASEAVRKQGKIVTRSTASSGQGASPNTSQQSGQNGTVAQVLTQAQYELSQELEANLKKLRSVIQQSQEIAKKIELVLGKGNKGSGTNQ